MNIRTVIFDFGGVLVQMVDDQPRLELANELGVSLAKLDDLVFSSESARKASRGEIKVSEHWEAVRVVLGIHPEDMAGFLERYWSSDDINWALLDFIRRLHPRYKVGLLSNAWDDLRQILHQKWNIDGLFDELIISAEVKMVKPEPRIFHLAVERMGVQPSETLFVDDYQENIVAARDQGLNAILYRDATQAIVEIKGFLKSSNQAG